MKEEFKKIWIDPVWSQVIAQIIIYGSGLIFFSFIKLIYDGGNFWTALVTILSFKIALWIYLLITLLLIFILFQLQKDKTMHGVVFDEKKLVVQITSLTNNAKVSRIEKIYGTYNGLPKNVRIRLFVVNESQSKCWLNSQKVAINTLKNTWESSIYFGSENGTQKIFYLVVAVDTNETDYWVEHFKQASSATQHWHPFDYPLPNSILECQKIRVQRID
jgi:hypothetical protein